MVMVVILDPCSIHNSPCVYVCVYVCDNNLNSPVSADPIAVHYSLVARLNN